MWHEKYLTLTYKQYNCAALLAHVWWQELKKPLNLYSNISTEVKSIIADNIHVYSDLMHKQASQLTQIDKPIDKCAVLMYSRGGVIGHVGIWLDYQQGYILHAHKDFCYALIQPATEVFKLNKLQGYYI